MKVFSKKIVVELLEEASNYYYNLPLKIQIKFLICFEKTEAGIKGYWFEKLKESDGIFEFKVQDSEKFYRIFAFWSKEDEQKTLILGTHGLDKKTNKTPINEIQKAERIKVKYIQSKKK